MSSLEVRLYGERVGTLERRGSSSVFEPAHEWLFARCQPLLGLSWLQDTSPRRASVGLPVWFEALLPDRGSALRTRLCASADIREDDSFALLGAMGQDLPGAARVAWADRDAGDDEQSPTPHPSPAGSLHFSLAGAQLKFSLIERDDKLVLPVHGEEGSFIAKIPGESFPMLPAIEAMTLTWASRCGHETPPHKLREIRDIGELAHLERFDHELCLVVQRYDRTETGPVHQEDLCQVFSVAPTERYDERGRLGIGYSGLVRFVRDACGAGQAEEFVRRVAFALASGNTDAHLQNWSLLLPRDGSIRLAPAYDQVSIIALPQWGWDRDGGPSLALPLGGVRRMAEMDRAAVDRFAKDAGDPRLAGAFFAALRLARRTWGEIEGGAIRPHREAVANHWRNVPLLASLD